APIHLLTPDFNRDGKMDLIVGSENTGNNSSPLYVLMSQGDGTFKASFLVRNFSRLLVSASKKLTRRSASGYAEANGSSSTCASKAFYGTSENAVKTQIWIAASVYVLVAIVRKRRELESSLDQTLQTLSVTLFENTP